MLGNAGLFVAIVPITRELGPTGRGTLAFITVTAIVCATLARFGVTRQLYGPTPWVPMTRWTLGLTVVVATIAAGGLAIVTVPALTGQARPDLWPGWGSAGFAIGSAVVLIGSLGSVFWPRLGAAVIVPGAVVGLFAAPWLFGSWLLAIIAGAARAYQADEALR